MVPTTLDITKEAKPFIPKRIFIIDQKHLIEAVQDPKNSVCSKILAEGFFIKKLRGYYALHITCEALEQIAGMYGVKDQVHTIECEIIINAQPMKIIPQYHKAIEAIASACRVGQKNVLYDQNDVTESTLSLISKRKMDSKESEIIVISDGNSMLTTKLKEKNIQIKVVTQTEALGMLSSETDVDTF